MGNKLSGRRRNFEPGSDDQQESEDRVRDSVLGDLTEIEPGLYLSSKHPAEHPLILKEKGIRRVVTVLPVPLQPIVDSGFERLQIPLHDQGTEPLSDYFMQCHNFITAGAFNKTGTATLVHCSAGRSRSASLLIAYLMISRRTSVREAYYYVAGKRSIQPNTGFVKQLVALEETLNLGGHDDVSILHTASGGTGENKFLAEFVLNTMMGGEACPCTVDELHDAIEECSGQVPKAQLLAIERGTKRTAAAPPPTPISGRASPLLVSGRRSPGT